MDHAMSFLSSPGLFGLPASADVSLVAGFLVVGVLAVTKLVQDRDKLRPALANRAETKRRAEEQRRTLNAAQTGGTRRGDLGLGGNSGQFVSPNASRGHGDVQL